MPSVLITGAASGIGREAAKLFAAAGWQCVLVDHNAQALQLLGTLLPVAASAPHQLRTIDLTDGSQVAGLSQGLPALDALINNAGMTDTSNTPLVAQGPEQLRRLLALNLSAPAAVVNACAAHLAPGARIVNVASGAGLSAIPWRGAYSPSKAGLIAQTQALARARPDWCVTVLAPGFVRTELVDGLIQAGRLHPQNAVAKIPLGRMADPAEMAHALFFLAGPGASALNGQVLALNGGSSVYGGSQPFTPARLAPRPLQLPIQLAVCGSGGNRWAALGAAPADTGAHAGAEAYAAVLDVSPLQVAADSLFAAVHAAAVGFAQRHDQHASLTLLLPRMEDVAGQGWQAEGHHAAARMLVATLACEWGVRALRVNALTVPPDVAPQALRPLLAYMGGAAAQYLTGQTLSFA
jgi:NAD(P)-dependent dehydrogenase (short-subunit alcohol dehydrogenase family)